ncbi:MAG TPA: hypothetical protein VK504_27405 [Vicinamibacterales bacterium]|nr:hypothetical protein [Vicinamibacterales bacterium]
MADLSPGGLERAAREGLANQRRPTPQRRQVQKMAGAGVGIGPALASRRLR